MRGHLMAAVAMMALATGCGHSDSSGGATAAVTPQLEAAHAACVDPVHSALVAAKMNMEVSPDDFMAVADGGHTLTIQNSASGGSASALITIPAITCVLRETKAPQSVTAELEQTTAMMGRQTTTWGDYKMDWSYHPDSGVSAVITNPK